MIWKPKFGDMYYVITIYGGVSSMKWADDNYDRSVYEVGNCFKTREEALFEAERRRVIKELKDFADEHNDMLNWNNTDQYKYYIVFGTEGNCIDYFCSSRFKGVNIYFTCREFAEQAVKQVGEERIKKYYLQVE